jgi:hypothetical protein
MLITRILSCRATEHWPSYHLVYEWEDDFAAGLQVPVVTLERPWKSRFWRNRYVQALANRYHRLVSRKRFNLVFELGLSGSPSPGTQPDSLPALVDFWKDTHLPSFYSLYEDCLFVLVSSAEVVAYLKAQHCPLPLQHFPLSLSDRYALDPAVPYAKHYDILLSGRPNPVLDDYLLRYVARFPQTECLRQVFVDDELRYVSNHHGDLGSFHSREAYMDLLRTARVSFYSTPGMDGGEARTGGFNPVTPRFLELLSAQCLLLGRYPENEETEFFEVASVCPNITSYEQFEATLTAYLRQPSPPLHQYAELLDKHYTSRRVAQLRGIMQKQRQGM